MAILEIYLRLIKNLILVTNEPKNRSRSPMNPKTDHGHQ